MTLEERMKKMEEAYGTQSDLMRELRDAVTVTAQLEATQARLLKEHLVNHTKQMTEHDERMKELDKRIAGLVSGIGEFIRRNPEKP